MVLALLDADRLRQLVVARRDLVHDDPPLAVRVERPVVQVTLIIFPPTSHKNNITLKCVFLYKRLREFNLAFHDTSKGHVCALEYMSLKRFLRREKL